MERLFSSINPTQLSIDNRQSINMTMMYDTKSRTSVFIDESYNATESSSMASSFEESDDSDLPREERWSTSSLKTKHTSLLRSESLGVKTVTAGESTSAYSRSASSHSSGNAIRSRLLNKLGFEPAASHRRPAFAASPLPSFHENNAFFVNLKADYGVADSNRLPKQDRTTNGKRRIAFNPEVKVQPIPSHTDFSGRIRRVMWTNAVEMDENAARNCLEYTAEGWDWRNVVDDEDMIVINGEKIHPVHFAHNEFNLNRQFAAVLSSHQQ